MNPILWPTCSCSLELAPRLFGILVEHGWQVERRETRPSLRGTLPLFQYVVSDGLRRLALIGIKHPKHDTVIVMLRPLRRGWRLHALFGREKFAIAVIDCLVRHGATQSSPLDEGKLRSLAQNGTPDQVRYARATLKALPRKKG